MNDAHSCSCSCSGAKTGLNFAAPASGGVTHLPTAEIARGAGLSTRAIHGGYRPDSHMGSINVPIYASTTFAQDGLAQLRQGFEYTRVGNPTIRALEHTVAALEGASYARAFSSGMAAIDAICRELLVPQRREDGLLEPAHLIFGHDAYGGTYRLLEDTFGAWGVEFSIVDTSDVAAVKAALRPNTRLVWIETPTNPSLSVTDIAAVVAALADHPARVVVDNTFASPALQQPLSLGADVVVHSTTKYLGGHSDVVGGVVVTNDAAFDEQMLAQQTNIGAIPSVIDAYLTIRGIKTLAVRMERHCDNAEKIAALLAAHPAVAQVNYPGLPEHPGHEVAKRQMRRFGGMISVRLVNPAVAEALCLNTQVICLAESLGGVESLIELPAKMTHAAVEGSELEVDADVVRLSVGIEDFADLAADLTQALDRALAQHGS